MLTTRQCERVLALGELVDDDPEDDHGQGGDPAAQAGVLHHGRWCSRLDRASCARSVGGGGSHDSSSATTTRMMSSSSTTPTMRVAVHHPDRRVGGDGRAGRLPHDRRHRQRRTVHGLSRPRLPHHPLQREHVGLGHLGDEVLDVVVGGLRDDLVGRADLHDLAVAQDHDPVTELERLGEVVGDEDHRLAELAVQPDDLVLHVAPDERVERGEGLVEEQHLGVAGQRPRQSDALLHATGELVGVGLLVALEPHQLDDLGGLGATVLLGDAAHLEAVGHVVDHLAVGQQAEVLEDHRHLLAAYVAQLARRGGRDVHPVERHRAAGRLDEPRQQPDQRRLPRPGQAHHHEDLARRHLEGDVLDPDHAVGLGLEVGSGELGVGRADDLVGAGTEDLPEVVDGQCCGHGCSPTGWVGRSTRSLRRSPGG